MSHLGFLLAIFFSIGSNTWRGPSSLDCAIGPNSRNYNFLILVLNRSNSFMGLEMYVEAVSLKFEMV